MTFLLTIATNIKKRGAGQQVPLVKKTKSQLLQYISSYGTQADIAKAASGPKKVTYPKPTTEHVWIGNGWDDLSESDKEIIHNVLNIDNERDWDDKIMEYQDYLDLMKYIDWTNANNIDYDAKLLWTYENDQSGDTDYCTSINESELIADDKRKVCEGEFMENTDNWSCKWNPISNKCEGEPQASPIRQQSRRFKGRMHFRDIRSRVLAKKQGKSGSNRWHADMIDNPSSVRFQNRPTTDFN